MWDDSSYASGQTNLLSDIVMLVLQHSRTTVESSKFPSVPLSPAASTQRAHKPRFVVVLLFVHMAHPGGFTLMCERNDVLEHEQTPPSQQMPLDAKRTNAVAFDMVESLLVMNATIWQKLQDGLDTQLKLNRSTVCVLRTADSGPYMQGGCVLSELYERFVARD
ncbi:hypothetical protein Efla_003738 [Eimeria flavescens]